MASNPCPEATEIAQWLAANRRSAPPVWVALGDRLLKSADLARIAAALRKSGVGGIRIMRLTWSAYASASNEFRRPPSKDELPGLERVRRLAGELKEAIEHSTLPTNWAIAKTLPSSTWGPQNVMFGWRNMSHLHDLGPALAIVDVMDLVVELVDDHIAHLPRRTVSRRRDVKGTARDVADEEFLRMFVLALEAEVRTLTGQSLQTTLAHIANAALQPVTPVDKRRVEVILRAARAPT